MLKYNRNYFNNENIIDDTTAITPLSEQSTQYRMQLWRCRMWRRVGRIQPEVADDVIRW